MEYVNIRDFAFYIELLIKAIVIMQQKKKKNKRALLMAFSPLLSPSPLHSSCSRLSFSAHNDRALEQGKREVGTALRDRGQQERAGSAAKPPSNRTVAGQGSPGGGCQWGTWSLESQV